MADETEVLTVAEMRRRRKAREALDDRVKNMTDSLVVTSRKAAADAATAKTAADLAATEALAVAVRLYGSAEDVTELTGIPTAEVDRAVKAVTVARVKELIGELRTTAEARVNESNRTARRRGTVPPPAGEPAPAGEAEAAPPAEAEAEADDSEAATVG